MVTTATQASVDRGTCSRRRHPAPPPSVLSVLPDAPALGPAVTRLLRVDAMVALTLEPGERIDTTWVERMRGPYTSRARHLVERALAPPAAGPPLAHRHEVDPVPTWAHGAAAEHRGMLDALGVDLPLGHGTPGGSDRSVLIQHLVPAVALGWYLVTTVHATAQAVLLLEGSYAEHGSVEAPFPVRWA